MIFKGEKYKLHITEQVHGILKRYIQDDGKKNEAGGVLLGQIKNNNIYLIRVTVPNKFDKASRFGFERNKEIAQILADYEFINSDKKTVYVGEWHTHPEDFPTPSGQDINMIKDQLRLSKHIEPYLFLLIQGRKDIYVGVYDGNKLIKMDKDGVNQGV